MGGSKIGSKQTGQSPMASLISASAADVSIFKNLDKVRVETSSKDFQRAFQTQFWEILLVESMNFACTWLILLSHFVDPNGQQLAPPPPLPNKRCYGLQQQPGSLGVVGNGAALALRSSAGCNGSRCCCR